MATGIRGAWRSTRRWFPRLARWWEALRLPVLRATGALSGDMEVRFATGHRARLHPAFVGWDMESYEADLQHALADQLRPGHHFVDVGAHVGILSILAAQLVGPEGRVMAFEPSPATYPYLLRHVRRNQLANVTPHNVLVGDTVGEQTFTYRSDGLDPGACANSLAYKIGRGRQARLPMTTLDALADTLPEEGVVLKVDVEGAELAVLRGARAWLARARPVVVCSLHPEPLRALGASPNEVYDELASLGYTSRQPAGEEGEEATVWFRPGGGDD